MAGCQSHGAVCKSSADCHSRQTQRLSHGGAGSIQAKKRNLQVHGAKGCGNQLAQQIPCKQVPYVFPPVSSLFQIKERRPALQFALRRLPVFLAEHGICLYLIKAASQRSLSLLLSHNGSGRKDVRGPVKYNTCFSLLHIALRISHSGRIFPAFLILPRGQNYILHQDTAAAPEAAAFMSIRPGNRERPSLLFLIRFQILFRNSPMTFEFPRRAAEISSEILKKIGIIVISKLFGNLIGPVSRIFHQRSRPLHLRHCHIGYVSCPCFALKFLAEIGM